MNIFKTEDDTSDFKNELHEKCAVVGVWSSEDASKDTYFGLFALQHRGQESTGIVTSNGSDFFVHKGEGLVSSVYTEEILEQLKGKSAIGHNRYSTSNGIDISNFQPITAETFTLAHNGNIPSVAHMQQFLKQQKSAQEKENLIDTSSDTTLMTLVIEHYLRQGKTYVEAIKELYSLAIGAFSCVLLTKDSLIAFRDPWGMRPLSLGKKQKTDGTFSYIVASETCALDTLGAEYVRDIEPGEIVEFTTERTADLKALKPEVHLKTEFFSEQFPVTAPKFDIFEFVYFARHDSILLGQEVYEVRKNFGKLLAAERKLDIDIIIPVPETAVPSALGYSQASGIPLELGLCKNRYIHRTFIQPSQTDRDTKVRMKLVPLKRTIQGKRVGIIDDSIVRGTTSKRIVKMLFEAGATEVHFLVTSAPIRFPDFYGIDTPNQAELIASTRTVEQVREYLGATTLTYLTVENMVSATSLPRERFSLSSFTGEYPIPLFEREGTFSKHIPSDFNDLKTEFDPDNVNNMRQILDISEGLAKKD